MCCRPLRLRFRPRRCPSRLDASQARRRPFYRSTGDWAHFRAGSDVLDGEKVFEICEDRIHAIFLFLSLLELVQLRYMSLLTGEGRNNFIVEWNENREEEVQALLPGEEAATLN